MIKHYRFPFGSFTLKIAQLLIAVFAVATAQYPTVYAAGMDPSYSYSPNSYIEATGGFITTQDSGYWPVFYKNDGKWTIVESNPPDAKNYINLSKPSVLFKSVGGGLYVTHVNYATRDIMQKPSASSENDWCYAGIKVAGSKGSFVGVNAQNKEDSTCTKILTSNTSLSTVNFSSTAFTSQQFLGVNVPTCTQTAGSSQYVQCVSQRKQAISSIRESLSCSTNSSQQISQCENDFAVIKCLESDPAKSVETCVNTLTAQAIAGGDLSTITGTMTDEQINDICKTLTNASKREACVKKATEQRDKLAPESSAKESTSCAIEKIGWIICPISENMAKGVDDVYGLVSGALEVKTFTNGQTGMRNAWETMRNIANVLFIFGFLIVIYSQITGAGISNYGVKKLLPKIIIAAILINVSYWLCAIAADLSNIVGSSIPNLTDTIQYTSQSTSSGSGGKISWTDLMGSVLTGSAVGGIAAYTSLAAAGSLTAVLWAAVPLLVAALFSIFMAFFVLAARQALLVILIVISPLALVAYMLPNTQKWYEKWQQTFLTLLFMYPIIAMVFAGSQLASSIILSNVSSMLEILVALTVQVIPLAITPLIIKFSGGLLGRFAGMVNDRSKGGLDRIKNAAKERQDLATKRGVAQGSGFINRMGRRRDLAARRRKSLGEQYEAESEGRWQRSNRGRLQVANTSYAQKDAAQETALNKGVGELRHLNDPGRRALNRSVTQSQAAVSTVAATQKSDDEAAHRDANPTLYDAASAAKGRNQASELRQTRRFEGSTEGRALADERQGLEDDVATVKAEQKATYLGSAGGQARSVTRKNAEQAASIADKRTTRDAKQSPGGLAQAVEEKQVDDEIAIADSNAEVEYLNVPGGNPTRQAAVNAKQEATNAGQRETNAAKASSNGRTLGQEARKLKKQGDNLETQEKKEFIEDATNQALLDEEKQLEGELQIAKTNHETEFAASPAGEQLAVDQAAAKESLTAASAKNDALVSELKTEEGAARNPQYATQAAQLSDADTEKRVQGERGGSADRVANAEYDKKLYDEKVDEKTGKVEKVPSALADTAGGVDPYGATRVVAAASARIDSRFNDAVTQEKSTMSSLDVRSRVRPDAKTAMTDPTVSIERAAALVGTVMGSNDMEAKLDCLRDLAEARRNAEASGDVEQMQRIEYMQLQANADMLKSGNIPFGLGDAELAALGRGDLKIDVYDQSIERIEEKMSVKALANLKPEEIKYFADSAGSLTDTQLDIMASHISELRDSVQYKDSIKGQTAADHEKILGELAKRKKDRQDAAYKTYEEAGNIK